MSQPVTYYAADGMPCAALLQETPTGDYLVAFRPGSDVSGNPEGVSAHLVIDADDDGGGDYSGGSVSPPMLGA